MPHSAILNPWPRPAPPARPETDAVDWEYIRAADEARARQDHRDFVALVEDEILPAMWAFEVLLYLKHLSCEIDVQGLRGPDAFRGTSLIVLHILRGAHSGDSSAPHPRLECVRSRRHPGEVILVTSGLPGRGGTSGQMRRYDRVTYGLVFDLLEQLLHEVVAKRCEPGGQRGPS